MNTNQNLKFNKIEMMEISKIFPGVQALDKVDFEIRGGTVHAIVGENGAGKSTLIKILAGVYRKDEGYIRIDGKDINIVNPIDAKRLGISVIYQEFSLVPELSISQNIFLGNEVSRKAKFWINKNEMHKKASEILKDLNIDINPKRKLGDLTVGEQQLVEIAKAINSDAKLIVMDEPTSALSDVEKDHLFIIIKKLTSQGIGVIYITHRMKEIFTIADSVTVMRDGKKVGDYDIDEVDENKLVKLMVGRELGSIYYREKGSTKGKIVLEVQNLSKGNSFSNISFNVKEGEVVGIAGLMGSGRTEIARCIFGMDKFDSGKILLNGREVKFKHPFNAISHGIGYVSEDRKIFGFVPLMDIKENITLPSLKWLSTMGWVNLKEQLRIAKDYSAKLDIKSKLIQKVGSLSGGNQQKVVLGKWLARNPQVLILDEPTRGIDVGAKSEIHKIINQLTKENIAVIMISSELPEILGVSDRIIVMHEGEMTAEFDYTEANEENIMKAAVGLHKHH
jgi:ribose transport system ATP-binding protein